ncbi:MAG TPA: MlaD family protein [Nitrospiraceae bacterium]|jgi:phospholipid/cholesterol/gamma-HCH transport system substrate-binding protein
MKMHYAHSMSWGRIAQIVGAFVMIPLAGLIVVGIFMAKAEHLFEEKYILVSTIAKSYGLEPGMPVLMAGISIGRVQEVSFDDRGAIHVALQVRKQYQDKIRTDSVANLGKSGMLVGQTQVQIVMGSADLPMLQDGATIKVVESRDMTEMMDDIKPVLASVQRTLLRVEEITKDMHAAVQTGGQVLVNVERATKELPTVVASVQRTAAAVERTTSSLPDLTASIKKTVNTVDHIAGDVRAVTGKLPAVTDSAQEAVDNIKAATKSVKDLTKELPPLVRAANSTLEDVNTILRGAKRTFPVSTMIKNAEPKETGRAGSGLQSLRGDQIKK